MRRTWGVVAVVLAALLLAGCTANSGASTGTSEPGPVVNGLSPQGIVSGDKAADAGGTASGVTTANRDVVTTGSMSITAADPIKASESAVTITEQAGGRIDSRSENPATDIQPASATLSLRIPSTELDRTLTELEKLGTVNFVTLNAQDVTQQSQDLNARITALQTSVDRLLALMATATNTTDLIAIESALSSRQSDLESLQSQRNFLADQIDFSTISLELVEAGTVASAGPDTFWSGLTAGWAALVIAFGGLLIGLGVALPWIVVLAVLGAIVLLIARLLARRRKAA